MVRVILAMSVISLCVVADNYAWYATAVWFRQFYGTPDPTPAPGAPHVGIEADTVPDNETPWDDPGPGNKLSPPPSIGYGNPDYDEITAIEAQEFADGNYLVSPDGRENAWIRGKKLRILPLGGNTNLF
jgi:hypothetical protein